MNTKCSKFHHSLETPFSDLRKDTFFISLLLLSHESYVSLDHFQGLYLLNVLETCHGMIHISLCIISRVKSIISLSYGVLVHLFFYQKTLEHLPLLHDISAVRTTSWWEGHTSGTLFVSGSAVSFSPPYPVCLHSGRSCSCLLVLIHKQSFH